LALGEVYLLGHDLGAVHAWHLAGLLRGRVKALATINGLPIAQFIERWRRPKQWLKSWYMFFFQVPVVPDTLLAAGAAGLLRRVAYKIGGLTPAQSPTEEDAKRAVVAPMRQYRAFFRSVPAELRRGTARLDCPVLSLWGERDPFLVPPTYDELAGVARRLTMRIIAGGHWLGRECPAEVNRVLDQFYSQAALEAARP
jgi:pimeloyl-ACP methyl ester carboxylesterase